MNSTKHGALVAPGLGLALAGAILLMACSSTPEPSADATPTTSGGASAAEQSVVQPAVSINALMVSSVDHAAHAIWDAAVTPPKTDDDWLELDYHAIQLAALGTMITVGGTGKADPGWVRLPDWQKYAQALTDSGVAARKAVETRDVKAVSSIGDTLVASCENCHKQFKPDVPTEGLIHKPEYPR